VGFGTEMRADVLRLAFEKLGVGSAYSDAWVGNEASLRVSEKLGYEKAGTEIHHPRGEPVVHQVMRLDAAQFTPPCAIDLEGVQPLVAWLMSSDAGGRRARV
jgi:RimJ/RimL family protein N-acetyltransferase